MMRGHAELSSVAQKVFADHRMRKGPGYSWRLAAPGKGAYAFRVTWAPGIIVVSGNIDGAIYRVWPAFSSVRGAVDLIHRADFDYLAGKSTEATTYDREATIAAIIERADERLNDCDDASDWARILKDYGYFRLTDPLDEAARAAAAEIFREDDEFSEAAAYKLTGDAESPVYDYPPRARWAYEAVTLWAATMVATEPAWHRAHRRLQRAIADLKSYRRYPVHYRPVRFDAGRDLNGSRYWLRVQHERDGQTRVYFKGLRPWAPFGMRPGRFDLWRETGISWNDPIIFERVLSDRLLTTSEARL
ncbi:conserved hypothetical protein [Hyphomicrobiales bacterium]|nr:conserved hypothetical protein [Hyphomicrobiales bacterium]CAH1667850.1 conserved hypothetical protein [Hyphomicrobiales bacterium]